MCVCKHVHIYACNWCLSISNGTSLSGGIFSAFQHTIAHRSKHSWSQHMWLGLFMDGQTVRAYGYTPHSVNEWLYTTQCERMAIHHTVRAYGYTPHSVNEWLYTTQCERMAIHHTVRAYGYIPHSVNVWLYTTQCERMAIHHTVRAYCISSEIGNNAKNMSDIPKLEGTLKFKKRATPLSRQTHTAGPDWCGFVGSQGRQQRDYLHA